MYRIAALNSGSGGSEADGSEVAAGTSTSGPSREVLESTAHADHSAAIQHMAMSQDDKAEESFLAVLNNPYIINVSSYSIVWYLCVGSAKLHLWELCFISLKFSDYC